MQSKRGRPGRFTAFTLVVLMFVAVRLPADELQSQFDDAMRAIDADQLASARTKLGALLAANPSLYRARLELARVHYLSRDYAAARNEAQKVLDDPNTPPSVRTTLLAFLAQISADEKRFASRHQWSPSIYGGVLYDSNVNVGPSRDLIDIGGTLFNLSPGSKERSDFGAVIRPAIAHTYNPDWSFDGGEHRGFFLWQSEVSGYYRAYFDEHNFNLGILTLRTGPAWVVPGHWRATLGLQGDQIWLGGDSLALFSTLNPGLSFQLNPQTEITLDAVLSYRNYWRAVDDGRDGWYRVGDISATHYFANRKFALQGGVGYFDLSADDDRFSSHGPEFFGGLVAEAWTNGRVFARVGYRHYSYDGAEPVFNEARNEDEFRTTLGFQHDFRSGWLAGWSLQGSWIHTDNSSNVGIYDYDRDQVDLGLARSW
jgi:hypothetical protein